MFRPAETCGFKNENLRSYDDLEKREVVWRCNFYNAKIEKMVCKEKKWWTGAVFCSKVRRESYV